MTFQAPQSIPSGLPQRSFAYLKRPTRPNRWRSSSEATRGFTARSPTVRNPTIIKPSHRRWYSYRCTWPWHPLHLFLRAYSFPWWQEEQTLHCWHLLFFVIKNFRWPNQHGDDRLVVHVFLKCPSPSSFYLMSTRYYCIRFFCLF